tara:strand:- start:176 stop:337 length:162 start_codon:yes stop_codon:yes gene_type:complete
MKDFEKLLKLKLAKDGISKEWMKKHLIVDTITEDDIDNCRDDIINLIEGEKNE